MSVLGAAAIAGGASLVGSWYQNRKSGEAAENQMDFQKEMSDTSYQRGVKDMRAAGLNPVLAAGQGGASTPGGAMANYENMGQAAVQGAATGAQTAQQGETAIEQQANLRANTALTEENIHAVRQTISASKTAQGLQEAQIEQVTGITAQLQHQTALVIAQTAQTINSASLLKTQERGQTYENVAKQILSEFYDSNKFAAIAKETGIKEGVLIKLISEAFGIYKASGTTPENQTHSNVGDDPGGA